MARIIIIEKDNTVAGVIKKFCVEGHYLPLIFGDVAEEVIGMLQQGEVPDLFTVNLGASLELLALLESRNLKVPVILISGAPGDANSSGKFAAVLAKPFTKNQVLEAIKKALGE